MIADRVVHPGADVRRVVAGIIEDMQRIHPSPGATSITDAYAAPLGEHPDRPWVMLCMVASIDGSTVVDGRSAGLSSSNDSAVLLHLRSIADVVLVGAGTAQGEGYGPPSTPGQRIGVVTRSGRVDTTTELFTSGAGFVITTESTDIADTGVDVIRAGRVEVDLHEAVRRIPDVCPGAAVVQAEGGATLNAALAGADVLDELNLTTSPAVVGGAGPRLTHAGDDHAHRYELAQVVVDAESFVFSRWRRVRRST